MEWVTVSVVILDEVVLSDVLVGSSPLSFVFASKTGFEGFARSPVELK